MVYLVNRKNGEPAYCTAKIDETVVSKLKNVFLKSYYTEMPTSFGSTFSLHLFIPESDMIAARSMWFTKPGRLFAKLPQDCTVPKFVSVGARV